jgi:hypothetical protein
LPRTSTEKVVDSFNEFINAIGLGSSSRLEVQSLVKSAKTSLRWLINYLGENDGANVWNSNGSMNDEFISKNVQFLNLENSTSSNFNHRYFI